MLYRNIRTFQQITKEKRYWKISTIFLTIYTPLNVLNTNHYFKWDFQNSRKEQLVNTKTKEKFTTKNNKKYLSMLSVSWILDF